MWTEALGFCIDFLSLNAHVRRKVWEFVQDDPKLPGDSGEVPISKWSGWWFNSRC